MREKRAKLISIKQKEKVYIDKGETQNWGKLEVVDKVRKMFFNTYGSLHERHD